MHRNLQADYLPHSIYLVGALNDYSLASGKECVMEG